MFQAGSPRVEISGGWEEGVVLGTVGSASRQITPFYTPTLVNDPIRRPLVGKLFNGKRFWDYSYPASLVVILVTYKVSQKMFGNTRDRLILSYRSWMLLTMFIKPK